VSEVSDRYGRVAAAFAARMDGCPADRWSAPSPCEGWTARDVAAHAVDVQRRVAATVGSEAVPVAPEEDAAAAWDDATADVSAALDDAPTASRVVTTPFGELPFEQLVGGLGCADALVHTWDFARATGQDERLDAEAVEVAGTYLTPISDRLRGAGAFGPELSPPEGADAQTALLCFLGRRV